MEVIKPFIPWGVLLGILGGGVPPWSPNPDLVSDQKMSFSRSHPFSDLAFRQTLCHNYLDQSANKKFFQMHSNSHISISFLFIWK